MFTFRILLQTVYYEFLNIFQYLRFNKALFYFIILQFKLYLYKFKIFLKNIKINGAQASLYLPKKF
jgi:hypothetical protein